MGKKIVFLIHSTPYNLLNNYEAIRASMALFDHEIVLAWTGDGVFFPLKSSDKGNTQPILRLFKDLSVKLLVDSDELAFRGYDAEDLIAEVEPVPRLKIVETLVKADSVLSF